MEFFLSPALYGYLGIFFSTSAQISKKETTLLALNLGAAYAWAAYSFALGSFSGGVLQVLGSIVCLYRVFNPIADTTKPGLVVVALCALGALLTSSGYVDIPVAIATVSLVYGVSVAKGLNIRYFLLIANTGFIVHAYLYDGYEQIFACLLGYIAISLGIYRSKMEAKNIHSVSLPNKPQVS